MNVSMVWAARGFRIVSAVAEVGRVAHRMGSGRGTVRDGLALAATFLAATSAAAEPYVLQKGDVLEISLAGYPDLRDTVPVNIDGHIVVAMAGAIPAAGKTLDAVTSEVREKLANLTIPVVGSGGESGFLTVHPQAVTVMLREYRPIYVDGDVSVAGAHPFVPGLTARQAIALAGGYGYARFREGDPLLQAFNLDAAIRRLVARRQAAEARLERLRADLGGTSIEAVEGAGGLGARLLHIEDERLQLRRERESEDVSALRKAIALTEVQTVTLNEQRAAETEGLEADREEYQRLLGGQRSGTVTAFRTADSRRSLLFSQTRLSETEKDIARTERELERLRNELVQRTLEDRTAALSELSEQTLLLAEVDAELRAARQSLQYVGSLSSDLMEDTTTTVEIQRAGQEPILLLSEEDVALVPGDLVRVRITLDPGRSG